MVNAKFRFFSFMGSKINCLQHISSVFLYLLGKLWEDNFIIEVSALAPSVVLEGYVSSCMSLFLVQGLIWLFLALFIFALK